MGKSEVMQTLGAVVFARIPSARDTSKTPALLCSNDANVSGRTAAPTYST
jgi:hypothetical protein